MTILATSLSALRLSCPIGSTVKYWDATIRGTRTYRKAVNGEVTGHREGSNDMLVVSVRLKDGILDTLPENLTLVRKPTLITKHDL